MVLMVRVRGGPARLPGPGCPFSHSSALLREDVKMGRGILILGPLILDTCPTMRLTSLRLRDFRCFESLRCDLSGGATLFVGDNAQGKTSILEAVCVLLRLQSPRGGVAELVRMGCAGCGISGELDGIDLRYVLNDGKRKLSLDGEQQRRAADYLSASGLVVWMGNEDIVLVRGGGEPRRRYLDFAGSQLYPDYRTALKDYEKALRSRNWLLKRDASPNWQQVDAYTEVLIANGEKLTSFRAGLAGRLAGPAADAHARVSGRDEALAMVYEPSVASDFGGALVASRDEEVRRRQTVVGPHRDDLALTIEGMEAGRFASEGQQRTVALALKLAQARVLLEGRDAAPLLLLDDIFGELDPSRRNALLDYLPSDAQKLITTTHLGWLTDAFSSGAIYTVRGAALEPWSKPS